MNVLYKKEKKKSNDDSNSFTFSYRTPLKVLRSPLELHCAQKKNNKEKKKHKQRLHFNSASNAKRPLFVIISF